MEAYANSSEMRVALCGAPTNDPQATFEFTFNNSGNTPDLLVGPGTVPNTCDGPTIDNVVAPQGTNMLSILGGGNLAFHKREGVAFPLCSTIQESECVVVRFWASKPPQCEGNFLAFIEFMPNPPVSNQIVYNNPGNISGQTQVAITHNLPQFGQYQVTITRPANSPAWNYLLFSVYRTQSPIGRAVFDDIQVIRPIPEFTYTADCQKVNFASTADCDDVVDHLWEFGDGTTSTLPNPTHHYLQPGTYSVTHTISLTCNGTQHNFNSQLELIVEDCPELFDCACETGININAEGGLPVSALGISSLDLSQHGGCLAIRGTLIVDQPFDILNGEVRMQPCSEIAVNAFRHLTMQNDNIYGCKTMWRGITVASSGRLTFRNNIVADAQYALLATPTGPFTGLNPTQVDIQHNRFERDHVGLYIPGTGGGIFGGNVWYTPFIGNVFECRGKNNTLGDLLPPCDAGLPNYDSKNGYTGVAILGANFKVGEVTGIRNQFINLRNGVIAENVFLDVRRSDFENMIGSTGGQPPGFAFSAGVGVAANGGIVDVDECTFDEAGHAVNHHDGLISFTNSQTDRVWTGLEVRRPFAVYMADNDQIGFLRHGVQGWDLRKSPWLEKYVFDHNVFQTQDNQQQAGAKKGHAMLLSNANNGILLSSDFSPQITNNIVNLDDYVRGIFVDGIGGWRVADNSVSINLPQNPPTATYKNYGFLLNRSDINYVYGNTVTSTVPQAALDDGIKGFEITMNTDNVFCCNATDGTDVGFNFIGSCMGTELRQTDFYDHSLSLLLQDNTIIGHQPYQFPGTNTTNSNRFWTGSGTAQHLSLPLIVGQSLFFVTNQNNPHHPDLISTPNAPSVNWFLLNQGQAVSCSTDLACPQIEYPNGGRSAISLLDLAVVSGELDTLLNADMLRWELARDLYTRLKTYPEMLGQAALVDSFYNMTDAGGPIKSFYLAELQVAEVGEAPENLLSPLQYLRDTIETVESECDQVLEALASASTRADSVGIYWQAQAVRNRLAAPMIALAEAQVALNSLRQTRATAALPAINALPESDLLQTNLKTVWRIYLEWYASGAAQLTEAQFDTISDIAHQCPLTGGRAVLVARGLYRSVLIENFDDDELCLPSGGRPASQRESLVSEPTVVIRPNPASNQAHLSFPGQTGEEAQVQVFDLAGRLVLQAVAHSGAHNLDLSAIRTGLYLCHVSVGSKQFPPVKLSIIR